MLRLIHKARLHSANAVKTCNAHVLTAEGRNIGWHIGGQYLDQAIKTNPIKLSIDSFHRLAAVENSSIERAFFALGFPAMC